jgi:hypothetical protein
MDFIDFLKGNLQEIKAHFRTTSGRVPIRLSIGDDHMRMINVVKAASQKTLEAVKTDLLEANVDGQWADDFKFNVEFASYSPDRAATSWLRSAYLAFFATLGYRFISRRELNVVRNRIKNPELKEPAFFRIIRPEPIEPTLMRVDEPEDLRSYAMFYGHFGVFLPRYNDHDLYERLARQPEGRDVTSSGIHYPWPRSTGSKAPRARCCRCTFTRTCRCF